MPHDVQPEADAVKRAAGCLGISAAAALVLQMGHALPARAADRDCSVADPTGTELNVRDAPNGRVLATLANGARLRQVGEREHKGKRWSLVANEKGVLGWVFSTYLDCAPADGDQLKSAPMHPRPTGN
ncbi:SH3 domain-containing protein [Ensifer adhaerens]|uniref:SH3 domain-containing protein n=1 Tax=Ensifer adhaerens TaxID=106592 RepID=UPI00131A469D|nr:SH3 domain-containing protein [Ensifer adhaerens]